MGMVAKGITPERFDAVLFDLDGVLTSTAKVHAACWKRMFDEFLRRRADETGEPFRPFDIEADYRPYLDGKPRYVGVESFLASRSIELPYGDPVDPRTPSRSAASGTGNSSWCRRRCGRVAPRRTRAR